MAARLGAQVTLCCPLGGETGTVLGPILAVEGVEVESVPTDAPNGAYVHDRRGGTRTVIAQTRSPTLERHELDDLYGVAVAAGLESDALVVTGPRHEGILPPEVFERLCRDMRENGRMALADLSGEEMTAALRGGLHLLKVSDEELERDGRIPGRAIEHAMAAGRRLREEGAANALISRSADPALLFEGETAFQVESPHFEPVDEHGAGDSLFAGMGVGLASGSSVTDAAKLGAAAGALNVARHGLGTGQIREVAALAEQVRVLPA